MFSQYHPKSSNSNRQQKVLDKQDSNLQEKNKEPDLSWKQWVGKAGGTPEQVKKAIETLGRQPKNAEELFFLINVITTGKPLSETLKEANEQSKWTPY